MSEWMIHFVWKIETSSPSLALYFCPIYDSWLFSVKRSFYGLFAWLVSAAARFHFLGPIFVISLLMLSEHGIPVALTYGVSIKVTD